VCAAWCHSRWPEEVGLDAHLLEAELAGEDLPAQPLVAGVEAPRVATHRHLARHLLRLGDAIGVAQRVGQRNLDLHVLARLQAGDRLGGVHRRGRAEDHGVHLGQGQARGEVGGGVTDSVLVRHLARLVELAAHQGDHLDAVDALDRVEMLDAEGARPGQGDLDRHHTSSRIRWPTAVLLAGTW
jgi:hypothetical protein